MGLKSIKCECQDAMKIDFDKYKPETFDRILVDAPCSALGQRPLIYNPMSVGQLTSYISYQRRILENVIKLLKPGGYLVYSTCTITVEENEGQVCWLLNKYKNMKLVSQAPYHYGNYGLSYNGLDGAQQKLLQRFGNFDHNQLSESVFTDTNGFFIAKFYKSLE